MKEKRITRVTFEELNNLEDLTDWERLRTMTDEEAYQNALEDPDNPPLSPSDLKNLKLKRIKRG